MASGDTLIVLTAQNGTPPATVYAELDVLAGTSTPAESIPVLAFDSAQTEFMDFPILLPRHYAGGGITLTVVFGAGTTTGGVRWEAGFRRVADDAEDLDTTAHTYDTNGVSVTTLPNVQGEVDYAAITFTDGADIDSLAVGEMAILRISRDHDHADDTAAADAYLHRVEIRET